MNRETDRLLLRQWRPEDFEKFAAYYADESLARFVGGRCDRETAWRKMAALAGHWVLRGFGCWAVEERDSGDLAGCVGLWQVLAARCARQTPQADPGCARDAQAMLGDRAGSSARTRDRRQPGRLSGLACGE